MDYKAKARAYHTAVSNYDEVVVASMVREDYIQHNPRLPTGRAAFLGFLPKLKQHGTKIVNIRMLNDGPYVIMHHVWKNAVPFGGDKMAAFHIIRFDSEGLIAEHWNVMTGEISVGGKTAVRDLDRTEANRALVMNLFRSEKQHRVFAEGNFVLSISEGVRSGKPTACYDLLRIERGVIADRWSIHQEIPTEGLANDNTMFGF